MGQAFPEIIFSKKIDHLRLLTLILEDIEGFIEYNNIFGDNK